MKNNFEKYWVIREPNWHEYKSRVYHVSSIGNSYPDLSPDEHYGPDLLSTFFDYVNKKEHDLNSKGNLNMGNLIHKEVQKIYRKNHPFAVTEFALQRLIKNPINKRNILLLGSIDIPEQVPLKLDDDPDDKITVNVLDVKSASKYTLPHGKHDKNPTYFTQLRIYAYWLSHFYLNPEYIKIGKLKLVYVNKHNCETIDDVEEQYEDELCSNAWYCFVERACKLDESIRKFYLYKNADLPEKQFFELVNRIAPKHEPHRWTKYNKYLPRIEGGVFDEKCLPKMTEKELQVKYEKETGRHAIWGEKVTSGYKYWKKNRGY